ncbi:hypothetical protein TNCV_1257771 [Trichonephila clavipes]|nr:hypothetical protein TNCV_1257771 [Trichonephila clavipes]
MEHVVHKRSFVNVIDMAQAGWCGQVSCTSAEHRFTSLSKEVLHRNGIAERFFWIVFAFLRGVVGPDFQFMDDNARPHRSVEVADALQTPQKIVSGVKSQDLGGQFWVQNVKLGGHQTCLSINRLWHELCDMLHRLVGTTALGNHDCSIQE